MDQLEISLKSCKPFAIQEGWKPQMQNPKSPTTNDGKALKKMDPIREAITRRAKSTLKMGVSMREFERKTGIPYATLQHWTDVNKNGLPETSIDEFINALKICGIACSHEWMMYGKGDQPRLAERRLTLTGKDNESRKRPKKHRSDESQIARIAEELKMFLQWDKDAIEYVVPDDALEPRFIQGEIVAGIRHYKKDIEKLIGQDCIVTTEKNDIYLRTIRKGNLPGHFHLVHTNLHTATPQPFFLDVKIVSAAPVIWARRKYSFK